MKTKMTMKMVKNLFRKRIGIGYCEATYLLTYKEANAYTSGIYGWNNDVYIIDRDIAIITGYRNIQDNVDYDYKLLKEYEEKARNICLSNLNQESKENMVNNLLNEFIGRVA